MDDDAGPEDGFGDDFDDFEDGARGGEDDDFGDFDDGLEAPSTAKEPPEPPPLLQDEHQPTFVSRQCPNSKRALSQKRLLDSHAYLVIADFRF